MFGRTEIVAAIKQLAGTDRLLIYDVREDEAPERANSASPFIRGSAAWWDFVRRRRQLDDGENLSLLISLRGLRRDERMSIVNWGTFFANTFLLIEPADPWLDLTTETGIAELAKAHPQAKSALDVVRAAYADWVYWYTTPEGEDRRPLLAVVAELALFEVKAALLSVVPNSPGTDDGAVRPFLVDLLLNDAGQSEELFSTHC